MKRLEHKTDMAPPHQRPRVLAQATQIGALKVDGAAVPVVQAGHAVEQGGFAHAGFAHDGDELVGRKRQ